MKAWQEGMPDAGVVRTLATVSLGYPYPFFLLASARMRYAWTNEIEHAAVTACGTMLWNPEFWGRILPSQRAWVCAHEFCHRLMRHWERRGTRDHEKWNEACDMAINWALWELGLRDHPFEVLMPAREHRGWSAERIYDALCEAAEAKRAKEEEGKGQGGQKAGGGGAAPNGPGNGAQGPQERADGEAGSSGTPADTGADSASLAAGAPKPGQGCGTLPPLPGSRAEGALGQAEVEREWRVIATQSVALERGIGDEAGHALMAAVVAPPPKTDWRRLIRNACHGTVARHGRDRRTWLKRGRRSQVDGVQYPGRRSQDPGIAVIVDTSGSTRRNWTRFVAEIAALAQETRSRLYLVAHDKRVTWEGWIEPGIKPAEVAEAMRGGGGTRPEPAFLAVGRASRRFDVLVYFTDGQIRSWPAWPHNCVKRIVGLVGSLDPKRIPDGARVVPVDL